MTVYRPKPTDPRHLYGSLKLSSLSKEHLDGLSALDGVSVPTDGSLGTTCSAGDGDNCASTSTRLVAADSDAAFGTLYFLSGRLREGEKVTGLLHHSLGSERVTGRFEATVCKSVVE